MSPMFVPGPVDVDPKVLAAQAKPMLPHRSKDFEAMFASTGERLKQVFFTEHRVFQGTHSGSGMQEMAVRNLAEKSVLACVNGAFAQRWYDVASANGKQTDKIEAEWGQVFQPDQLRDALKAKHYELVLIVHNETSTGAENPVAALCKAVHEASPDTLIAVDAVSSLGGVKIPMDEWGIDFLLTSSQKCFALPPGLSFAGVNERAMKKAETVANRGWYFDMLLLEKHRVKDSTPMTPGDAADLRPGCAARPHAGRGAGCALRASRLHGPPHAGLGRIAGDAAAGCRTLPIQDGLHGEQFPRLGYFRAQQILTDKRHAHRQRLR